MKNFHLPCAQATVDPLIKTALRDFVICSMKNFNLAQTIHGDVGYRTKFLLGVESRSVLSYIRVPSKIHAMRHVQVISAQATPPTFYFTAQLRDNGNSFLRDSILVT